MKGKGKHCGRFATGRKGGLRLRRGHLFRREEKALPPLEAPQRSRVEIVDRLEVALRVLAQLPPPWCPDIDEPIAFNLRTDPVLGMVRTSQSIRLPMFDAGGKIVDGDWTGKIYTEGGVWRPNEEAFIGRKAERYVSSAALIGALCEIRNALPDLIKLARIGAQHLDREGLKR